MPNIKILDCTLRDGGYINNWVFGSKGIKNIIELLSKANIDYIETGFLTNEKRSSGQSLYNSFSDIEKYITKGTDENKLYSMITFGKFDINNVPKAIDTRIKGLRLIFKKHQEKDGLKYCEKLKDKGYKLFVNPTFIDQFQYEELIEIIKKINNIEPYAMSIVDSMGTLNESNLTLIYQLINENLKSGIALCLHLHNNLEQSYSNVLKLIQKENKRELIIDSGVLGMGRGAGILPTELIIKYLNNNHDKNYDLNMVLELVDKYIRPIYKKAPWGYSIPYYLTAINRCHPNYGKFLAETGLNSKKMDDILKSIPDDKKAIYDEKFIKVLV